MSDVLTIIPARLASTRLPRKPLVDIAGKAMIIRVMEQAQKAQIGPVIVACAEEDIAKVVRAAGGQAVLTDPDLPSGSDRVHQAAARFDPDKVFDIILNVQGDMPLIPPQVLRDTVAVLAAETLADIATAVIATDDPAEITDPNCVKAVVTERNRALYFSREAVPHGATSVFHHVGIYAYRRPALEKFCALPPSHLEQQERLEQLRALENDMRLYVTRLKAQDKVSLRGVDTMDDLFAIKESLL